MPAFKTFQTAELDGIPLAYAVAMAEGRAAKRFTLLDGFTTVAPYQFKRTPDGPNVPLAEALVLIDLDHGGCIWHPHISAGIGAPILFRERISVTFNTVAGRWIAYTPNGSPFIHDQPLVAGLRAHIASKLGETVEIPETLE